MQSTIIDPAPPNLEGLAWRPIHPDDLDAIVKLARDCFQVDGGLGFLFEPDMIQSRYFPGEPWEGIGAFMPDGRLAACSTVSIDGSPGVKRAIIVGQVRPEMRNKGIGTYLMRWSLVQARNLMASVDPAPGVMQVATESLTEPAHHLYLAHGFQNVFDEFVMERDLHLPLPDRALPPGVTITHWEPSLAGQFFQAYQAAFRERPGFPGWSAAEWIDRVTEDDHKPEWSLLARLGDTPAGFVIGSIDLTIDPPNGYVWQVGVVPAQRRQGLASTLLVETMRRMQAAGSPAALLTVHVNNSGAIQAYARLGFATIGRRARYERAT